jgi:RNA polymerase sigma factor (TIGR02999 family)
MTEVTRILSAIEDGDPYAAEKLLPLVYDELRKLAAQKMAQEKPGQTLQATALVHEAYVRLVDVEQPQHWNSRGHFFAAAAEAMRRILVEAARRKQSLKGGAGFARQDAQPEQLFGPNPHDPVEVLAIHESLERLAHKSARRAELV